MRHLGWAVIAGLFLGDAAGAAEFTYKAQLLDNLVKQVPEILKTFDPESGNFGTGIWICRDQQAMYPLAVAYSTPGDGNPYHKDSHLLAVIVKSGDPLIANMDERGQWVFAKKDGSTWGKIWMPWTYSRWIRTYQLIRDDMSPERRAAWKQALTLGFMGISQKCLGHVHNIPAHHAMGLYAAGQALDRPEWCEQAADFMETVIGRQAPGGYWSEGAGPVVLYNFVYVDALGTYFAMSDDKDVLPALGKAAAFHRNFTYPGGQNVETIDQRNPYRDSIAAGNVGFTFTPTGRAYLRQQWTQLGMEHLDADLIASLLLYGEEGSSTQPPPAESEQVFVLTEDGIDRAATIRRGPWFICLSAYTAPVPKSRWIQDRQNFVSVYHDRTGLILGGGNTKLQPAWSTFTVGDTTHLAHVPGDTNPDFLPKGELYHVPKHAMLTMEPDLSLTLAYGPKVCCVSVQVQDERTLKYTVQASTRFDLPVAAHLTLMPHIGQLLETGAGQRITIGAESLDLSPEQVGGEVTYAGCRLRLPPTASLRWPTLPHNPYRKDGRAEPVEGRIAIRIPFDRDHGQHDVTLVVLH